MRPPLLSRPVRVIALAAVMLVSIPAFAVPAHAADCADGVIETVAGNDRCCYWGDDGPATEASLHNPSGLAVGHDGSLYIADDSNARIRKVDPNGIITTVAGREGTGTFGDGGPATEAALHTPSGVAIGPDGSLYIADYNNPRIGKVDPAGIITAIAGTGEYGDSGDGGPAVEAELHAPWHIAVAADGTIYFTDLHNHRVRKIDTAGIITTIAGTDEQGYSGDGGPATEARLNRPAGLALDADGSLYVADSDNHRIRKVDPAGIITTVAGDGWKDEHGSGRYSGDGGPATGASLRNPRGVAVAADGSLYIADGWNSRVRKVDREGVITTIAGNGEQGDSGDGGPATEARLSCPCGLAMAPDGSLYISDRNSNRVRKVDPAGVITTVAGDGQQPYSGDGVPASQTTLYHPSDVAFGADGSLYIADSTNWRIRKVDPAGVITTIAGGGSVFGKDADGRPATEAHLGYVTGVAVGPDGSIYIADMSGLVIRKVDPQGIISTVAGDGWRDPTSYDGRFAGDGGPATEASFNRPAGVAVGPDGSVYIADLENNRIRKIDPAGIITTVAGNGEAIYSGDGGPATQAALREPWDVAVQPDGTLYIADWRNDRVRKVDPAGIITTVAGSAEEGYAGDGGPATKARLDGPCDVAVAADGTLYISDRGNHGIRKVDPDGTITTLAGAGLSGYWGDGGPARHGRLHAPTGLALGPDGALYVADRDNNRIRRIRWRPCDPAAARAAADDLRAKAGESVTAWREVAELYIIAKAWDDALAAADWTLGLVLDTEERMRTEILIARVYSAKRDDHEARRRLIRTMARADDPVIIGEAASALVDLYLLRGEHDQAIATLNDLRLRAQDPQLRYWIDARLAQIVGD